jgi:hypothetical protein
MAPVFGLHAFLLLIMITLAFKYLVACRGVNAVITALMTLLPLGIIESLTLRAFSQVEILRNDWVRIVFGLFNDSILFGLALMCKKLGVVLWVQDADEKQI